MLEFSYHIKVLSGRLAFNNEDNLRFNVGITDIVGFYFSLQALLDQCLSPKDSGRRAEQSEEGS